MKAVAISSNEVAIAGGDGVWFLQLSTNPTDTLIATRGIFGQYPKTSMICL